MYEWCWNGNLLNTSIRILNTFFYNIYIQYVVFGCELRYFVR